MKKFWESKLFDYDELDLSDLKNAHINEIGFHPEAKEGGLTFDYEKDGIKKRIILGYNELGTWIEWQGHRDSPSNGDLILLKISEMIDNGTWDEIDFINYSNNCYRFMSYNNDFCNMTFEDIESLPKDVREKNAKEIFTLTIKDIESLPDRLKNIFQKQYESDQEKYQKIKWALEIECS